MSNTSWERGFPANKLLPNFLSEAIITKSWQSLKVIKFIRIVIKEDFEIERIDAHTKRNGILLITTLKQGPVRCISLLFLSQNIYLLLPRCWCSWFGVMLLVWGWTFGLRLGIPLIPHNLPFPVFIWLLDQELYSQSPSSPAADGRQRGFLVTIITWGKSHNKSHDICPSICLSSPIAMPISSVLPIDSFPNSCSHVFLKDSYPQINICSLT